MAYEQGQIIYRVAITKARARVSETVVYDVPESHT